MLYVTAEQVEQAKRWDLLSYLQAHEPQELKRSGPHEYRTVTHDSLMISNGKWHWCSRGVGGTTALDYLIKVREIPFVEAVQTLCDGRAAPFLPQTVTRPSKPPKPFELPEPNDDNRRVIEYLCSRGIDPEIIRLCVQAGILYESRRHYNCVFVGRDKARTPRFACLRGTMGNFKQDVEAATSGLASACRPVPRPAGLSPYLKAPLMPFPTRRYGGWKRTYGTDTITCPWAAHRRWRCWNT